MTRQQRRSKSQYLNGCRKVGYKPSKGYFYRNRRWEQRYRFSLLIAVDEEGNTRDVTEEA